MPGIWLHQLIVRFYISHVRISEPSTVPYQKKDEHFPTPLHKGVHCTGGFFFLGNFLFPYQELWNHSALGMVGAMRLEVHEKFRCLSCEMLQWKEVSARNSIHLNSHFLPRRRPPSNLANDNMMITDYCIFRWTEDDANAVSKWILKDEADLWNMMV